MAINITSNVDVEYVTNTSAWTNVYSFEITPGDTLAVKISAIARKASNGDCGYWEKRALLRRDDTDPVNLIGAVLDVVTPIKTLGAALWDMRIRSDGDSYFYLDVKGASGADVGWTVYGDGVSVDYPV